MRLEKKPRILTRPYWRHLFERAQSKLNTTPAQEQLDERFKNLPAELRLEIQEHYLRADPIRVGDDGELRHPLVDKNVTCPDLRETAALYRAAPIVLSYYLLKTGQHGRYYFDLDSSNKPWAPYSYFLEHHDRHLGRAHRKHLRLEIRITIPSNCYKKLRFRCDELGRVTFQPGHEHACRSRHCERPEQQVNVWRHIDTHTNRISEHTEIPRENINTEVAFVHYKCQACGCAHARCKLKIMCMGPPYMALCLMAYVVISWQTAYCGWDIYKKWRAQIRLQPGIHRYTLYASFLLPVFLGGVFLTPLAMPLKWTVQGSEKAAQMVVQIIERRQTARKAMKQRIRADAEAVAATDASRKQGTVSAVQLGSFPFENRPSEPMIGSE